MSEIQLPDKPSEKKFPRYFVSPRGHVIRFDSARKCGVWSNHKPSHAKLAQAIQLGWREITASEAKALLQNHGL